MGTMIKMDAACIKFFVGPPAQKKDTIYLEAVRRAYGDMSRHTLHFESKAYTGTSKGAANNCEILRGQIKNLLEKSEQQLFEIPKQSSPQDIYDSWHQNMCQEISDIFTKPDENGIVPIQATPNMADKQKRQATFSMGQAQKVLNMVWKYVYMFYNYYYAVNGSYSQELAGFDQIIPYLHTPIDSYVTNAACDKPTSKFGLGCTRPKYPWSQLFYNEYLAFQKDIRDKLASKRECPFLWELENFPFK